MQATPLKRIRCARGLTQEMLSALSGVSVRAIRDIEHEKFAYVQPGTLRALADALEIDAAALRLQTFSPAGPTRTALRKHSIHKTLQRVFEDDPPCLLAAMALFYALCDAESAHTGLAAAARFWLKYGEGRTWLEMLGADRLFDQELDALPALPGEGEGPEIVRLSRLMDLEDIA